MNLAMVYSLFFFLNKKKKKLWSTLVLNQTKFSLLAMVLLFPV